MLSICTVAEACCISVAGARDQAGWRAVCGGAAHHAVVRAEAGADAALERPRHEHATRTERCLGARSFRAAQPVPGYMQQLALRQLSAMAWACCFNTHAVF